MIPKKRRTLFDKSRLLAVRTRGPEEKPSFVRAQTFYGYSPHGEREVREGGRDTIFVVQPVDPRLLDYVTVAALVVGPIVAALITIWLTHRFERGREDRDRAAELAREERIKEYQREERRRDIFRTLMTTRQEFLHVDHVRALNSIDVEFYKFPQVRSAWRAYADHLGAYPKPVPPATQVTADADVRWGDRRDDLFFDLLLKLAGATGYEFDATDIRRLSYRPKGHGDLEVLQLAAIRGIAEVFGSKRPLWVANFTPPSEPEQGE